MDIERTYMQLVNEMCQRLFRGQTATVKSSTWQGGGDNSTTVVLTLPQEKDKTQKKFEATAWDKKAAKQNAAKEAYAYLCDKYGEY